MPRFILLVSLLLFCWAPTAGAAAIAPEHLFHIYILDTRLLNDHDSDVRLYLKRQWRTLLDQVDRTWKEPARHRGLLVAKTPGMRSASMVEPIDGNADTSGKAIDDHIDTLKRHLPAGSWNGYIDIGGALKAAHDDVSLVLGQLAQRVRDTNTPQRLSFVVHFLGDDLRFQPMGSVNAISLRDYELQKACFTGAGLAEVVMEWTHGFKQSHLVHLSIQVFARPFRTEGLPAGMLDDVVSATTGHSTLLGQPLSFQDKGDMPCDSEPQASRQPVIPPSVSPDLCSEVKAATAAPQAHACEGKRPDGRARRLRASVKSDVSEFTLDDITGTCGQGPNREREQKTERMNCFRSDSEEGKRLEARRRAAIAAAVSGAAPRGPGVAGLAAGNQPQSQLPSQIPSASAIRSNGPGATPPHSLEPPKPEPPKSEPPKPEPPAPTPSPKPEPPAPLPSTTEPGQPARSPAAPPPFSRLQPAALPSPTLQPRQAAESTATPPRRPTPRIDSVFRRGIDAPPFRNKVEITVLEADPPGIERSISFSALPDGPAPGGARAASMFRIEASTATDRRVPGGYTLAIEPRDRLQCRLDSDARLRLVVTGIAVESDSRGTYDIRLHDICGYVDSALPFGRMILR
ncbi:hypothetical protein [Azospirillum ramasamyi]|uniref:hypothetical protein n=1 Tax=Azospirillum ramasamyi TaxID=682998 RepID=UPI0013A6C5F2|nr:hypothetical protein [Azospirillum ramasamyi]